MEYDNTNRGSIWKNDRKEKDTQPDFTGSINVDGKEYWLNAWKKKEGANANAPILSFSVKEKELNGHDHRGHSHDKQPMYSENGAGEVKELNDDIPF